MVRTYFREDLVHGIHPGVEVLLREREDIPAILGELVAKEAEDTRDGDAIGDEEDLHISQVDLANHIDEVEKLTDNKLHEVGASSC